MSIIHILYIGFKLSFNSTKYQVGEVSTLENPVLVLNEALNCSSDMFVWVNIIDITTDSKLRIHM